MSEGSKYVNPTGDGYLGTYKLGHHRLQIPYGSWPQYTWRQGDDLWAVPAAGGVAIVEGPEPPAALAPVGISLNGVAPCAVIPARAIRPTLDVDGEDDVRVYERAGRMVVVPADGDPMLQASDFAGGDG